MSEQAYQAVGVIAGRLDGDRIHLIDGETFPAALAPVLRQWVAKHQEEAAAVRIWLAYPRTMKPADGGLAFYLVGTPDDQTDPKWTREIDRFTIKGQVMDSRSQKDFTVIRVPRNRPAPSGKRRDRNWLPHLLFLRRALKPVKRWKATDVWLECKREGRRIFIANYRPLHHHPTTITLPVGIALPWPIRPARSTITAALKNFLPKGHTPLGKETPETAVDSLAWVKRRTAQFTAIHQAVATTLEPAAAAAAREPLTPEEKAADLLTAQKAAKFFDKVLTFLSAMEPGQLAALCRSSDPLLAINSVLTRQLDDWFTVANPSGHRLRFFYDGRSVPRSVANLLCAFYSAPQDTPTPPFSEPIKPGTFFQSTTWLTAKTKKPPGIRKAKAPEPEDGGAAEMPLKEARRWMATTLGIPTTFSNLEAMAALVALMEEDGFTPLQIKMRLGLLPSQLAQFKRVQLPQQFRRQKA